MHAYIGISQIIDWPENDRLCREWAINEARKRGHKKAVDELIRLGEPPYIESFEQWGRLRKWLMKYNSMIYKDKEIQPPSLVQSYFDQLNATKSKHLIWVEKSSHMFHHDDAKAIESILIEHVSAAID